MTMYSVKIAAIFFPDDSGFNLFQNIILQQFPLFAADEKYGVACIFECFVPKSLFLVSKPCFMVLDIKSFFCLG